MKANFRRILKISLWAALCIVLLGAGTLYIHLHDVLHNTHPELPTVTLMVYEIEGNTDSMPESVSKLRQNPIFTAINFNPKGQLLSFTYCQDKTSRSQLEKSFTDAGIYHFHTKTFASNAPTCGYANMPNWVFALFQ